MHSLIMIDEENVTLIHQYLIWAKLTLLAVMQGTCRINMANLTLERNQFA